MKWLFLVLLLSLSTATISKPILIQSGTTLPYLIPNTKPVSYTKTITTKYQIVKTSKDQLNKIMAKNFSSGLHISSTSTFNILSKNLITNLISVRICKSCSYVNGQGACTMLFCAPIAPLEQFVGTLITSSWRALAYNSKQTFRLYHSRDFTQWMDLKVVYY